MINSEQVQALIDLGKSGSQLSEPLSCFPPDESGMSIFYSQLWRDKLWLSKRDEDLIALFKGLVIAEGFYPALCGSTTVTGKIYSEIGKRRLDAGYDIAQFAFKHAKNSYTPYGGIQNWPSLIDYMKYLWASELEDVKDKLKKQIRLANEAASSARKNEQEAQKNMEVMRYRMSVARMPVHEFISEVTKRSDKPLVFFSEEIRFRLEQNQFSMEQKLHLLNNLPDQAIRNVRELKDEIKASIDTE